MTPGSWMVAIRRIRLPQRGHPRTRRTSRTPGTPAPRTAAGRPPRRPPPPRTGRTPSARESPDGARCARRRAGDTRALHTPPLWVPRAPGCANAHRWIRLVPGSGCDPSCHARDGEAVWSRRGEGSRVMASAVPPRRPSAGRGGDRQLARAHDAVAAPRRSSRRPCAARPGATRSGRSGRARPRRGMRGCRSGGASSS